MAELTAEELAAQEAARRAYEEERETTRFNREAERDNVRAEREAAAETRRIRLETVKLAKETLIENSRSKAVNERDISSEDIKTFANVLFTFTIS